MTETVKFATCAPGKHEKVMPLQGLTNLGCHLDITGKGDPQLKTCLHQIGLWTYLREKDEVLSEGISLTWKQPCQGLQCLRAKEMEKLSLSEAQRKDKKLPPSMKVRNEWLQLKLVFAKNYQSQLPPDAYSLRLLSYKDLLLRLAKHYSLLFCTQ